MRRFGPLGLVGAVLLLCAPMSARAVTPVPVVAPGHSFAVDVAGFVGGASVGVQLVGTSVGRRVVHADRRGHVHVSYQAPTTLGRYRLLVSGPSRTGFTGPSTPPASTAGDAQVISVTVPLVIGVPFQVGGSGIDARTIHRGGGGSNSSGTDGLATTGSDLRLPLVLAGALCLLGIVATLAGRRRARP